MESWVCIAFYANQIMLERRLKELEGRGLPSKIVENDDIVELWVPEAKRLEAIEAIADQRGSSEQCPQCGKFYGSDLFVCPRCGGHDDDPLPKREA